ncbi:MAG: M20/M25/M40 family metallo-hydrolase [Candidatus Micrarchaeota archaeon]|nr:M20/M25/M40 family metallo-hydrolase [Candidatus Micrarchaeota archaeon]
MSMIPVDFLDKLVATPSPSGNEQKAIELCIQYMRQFQFEKVWIDEVGNAIATNYLPKPGIQPDLLLFGHADTISAPMPHKREYDRIHGRGSVDAKSPLAALLTAAGEQKVSYKVMAVAVVEEETSSKGAYHLLKHVTPKMAINGEPTNTTGVTVAYKGRLLVECRTHGKASHAGMASENPIERTIEYYQKLRSVYPLHKNNFDSVILNITHIEGGSRDALNVVPEKLDFEIDVRVPPSIPPKKVADTFRKLAPSNVTVKVLEGLPGVETSVNHPVCRSMIVAIRESGLHPRYVKKSGSADMNIAVHSGIPTVAYGSGDSSLDHTPNEVVLIKDYEKSIEIIKRTMKNLEKSF